MDFFYGREERDIQIQNKEVTNLRIKVLEEGQYG
jgi:hypothetical protein